MGKRKDLDPTSTKAGTYFRAGVGACITNGHGAVLVLERADVQEPAWQMPQGGIDAGEEPAGAVIREIREETGLDPESYVALRETEWLVYELPRAYWSDKIGRGQAQRWFLFRLVDEKATVRPDGKEFRSFRWVQPSEVVALAVPFRRAVYERVLGDFATAIVRKERS